VKGEGLLYPSEKISAKKKEYRGSVWLAPEFPRALTDLLPIIQVDKGNTGKRREEKLICSLSVL